MEYFAKLNSLMQVPLHSKSALKCESWSGSKSWNDLAAPVIPAPACFQVNNDELLKGTEVFIVSI